MHHLSSQPTPWHRAGSPHLPVYLVLQAPVPYPTCIAAHGRGLLPHVFTLTVLARLTRKALSSREGLALRLFSATAGKRLLPSVLSTAGCPFLSGLSSVSEDTAMQTLRLLLSALAGLSVQSCSLFQIKRLGENAYRIFHCKSRAHFNLPFAGLALTCHIIW